MKDKTYVAVSGGFDILHEGHINYIKEAKKLGDELFIFLNTDEWLVDKKGFYFTPLMNRKRILELLFEPYAVYPVYDVAQALMIHRPNIFAKGGDRKLNNLPPEEIEVCDAYKIEIITGVGGNEKPYSSRESAHNVIKAWSTGKIPVEYLAFGRYK